MSGTVESSVRFPVAGDVGLVTGILMRPANAWLLYVMAPGAGAGITHPFLSEIAGRLAMRGIATFRYQFPYMEARRRRPDPSPLLEATVRSAVAAAREETIREGSVVPLVAGGKSMGGRMTSRAAAAEPLPGILGLVFLGFPLHRPRVPSSERADHLISVDLPLLFLQGTRDALADLRLIHELCRRLGPRARLHIVEGADHGFAVLQRSGRTGRDVMEEMADVIAGWARDVVATGAAPGSAPSRS